ncbi:hypothetical protein COU57_05775 [Candidatus Pacearchaeota archaeon CG10_big_fil_rev_8_21_14_0_10_32_14]|nr:MAG: hypothetical protein COU57_05775 [Candidatus Pacearchaeota archaeon CG10_big_fil_rev_8_21_14_0_10_32_14]
MRIKPLTPEEKAILDNPDADAPLIEIINGMTYEELKQFDQYTYKDRDHYMGLQRDLWFGKERYLISHRLGHDAEVSSEELVDDINAHKNGERYRAWYVMKFPNMVKRKVSLEGNVETKAA